MPTAPPLAAPAPNAPTSGKALASMITGIFGLLLLFPAIAAIILGHISRSEIRKSNGRLQGNGMAMAGLIMGYMVIAFLPSVLIIAAIAIANLPRARISANEAAAVASIRTINTAEIEYQSIYPTVGFAATLDALGGSSCKPPSSTSACLIDRALASGSKNGYTFTLKGVSGTPATRYQIIADPVVPNQSGGRYFCSFDNAVPRVSKAPIEACDPSVMPLQ